jgi:hypothetical protein
MTPNTLNPTTSTDTTKTTRTADKKSQVLELGGLCLNCSTAETCMYTKNGKAVHHCEEFDAVANVTSTMLRQPIRVASSISPKDPTGLKGLCVNCDHHANCLHAKAQGGVWHCEDYQ